LKRAVFYVFAVIEKSIVSPRGSWWETSYSDASLINSSPIHSNKTFHLFASEFRQSTLFSARAASTLQPFSSKPRDLLIYSVPATHSKLTFAEQSSCSADSRR
jgi:hypothetical protein